MIYLIANLNLSDLKLLFPKTDPRTIQTGQLCQPCFEICQKKDSETKQGMNMYIQQYETKTTMASF